MTSINIQVNDCATCVALSGNRLAVGISSNEILLFDISTGETLGSLPEPDYYSFVATMAFSPIENGRLLATGGKDRRVCLWDTFTKKCVMSGTHHSDIVSCLDFSPDGKTLASGSYDSSIMIWDVARGVRTKMFGNNPGDSIYKCKFFGNGEFLAYCSADNTVRLHELSSAKPKELEVIRCKSSFITMDLSVDNMLAINTTHGIVEIWNLNRKPQLETKIDTKQIGVSGLQFSPDGNRLATSGEGPSLKIWNWRTSVALKSKVIKQPNLQLFILDMIFLPDGKQLLCATSVPRFYLFTTSEWDDREHHLSSPDLKKDVFRLMAVKERQDKTDTNPRLPMNVWLNVFKQLAEAKESE
jgi:WD40 repeat protein